MYLLKGLLIFSCEYFKNIFQLQDKEYDLGTFDGNGAEGRENTHMFYSSDHREERTTANWRGMGDNQG